MKFEKPQDELERIRDMLEEQRAVVMRTELEHERKDAFRKTFEARLIQSAGGKSQAEKTVNAQATKDWELFHRELIDLKKIAENERLKFELMDKEWLRVYANNKLDGHLMRRQG